MQPGVVDTKESGTFFLNVGRGW